MDEELKIRKMLWVPKSIVYSNVSLLLKTIVALILLSERCIHKIFIRMSAKCRFALKSSDKFYIHVGRTSFQYLIILTIIRNFFKITLNLSTELYPQNRMRMVRINPNVEITQMINIFLFFNEFVLPY